MSADELIDLESLDFGDSQTWLYHAPEDSDEWLDMQDLATVLDLPKYDDEEEYQKAKEEINYVLDEILKMQMLSVSDRPTFDSRTYVKPKKKRPGIQHIFEGPSSHTSLNNNKYMTYSKYASPFGALAELGAFGESESISERELTPKRSLQDLEEELLIQFEEMDVKSLSSISEVSSSPRTPSRTFNIDLTQPANNVLGTFNKGALGSNRGILNLYPNGESLMRVSPPSLVSSLLLDGSGNFDTESPAQPRDTGMTPGRGSLDPMVTSMTLSILDEKDMCTSFLSQATDNEDSFLDCSPPSLVSSANSSYIVHNPRTRPDSTDSASIFTSATFTRLEQSEKLLSARPRHQLYNSYKPDNMPMRMSESYTKTREEACQIDSSKALNENSKESKPMTETITLHHFNNKFRDNNEAEKENLQDSFEKSDAFYKDMEEKVASFGDRDSLNVTMNKQELNEIIQARQKLSLARQGLPVDPERLADQVLPNQMDLLPKKSFIQTVSSPKRSIENIELPARRIIHSNGFEKPEEPTRDSPKRNATYKKDTNSPRASTLDTQVVYVKDENPIIDINSATLNLIDSMERNIFQDADVQDKWGSQERAMVGSSESTDTATFSSSSPPDSVPDTAARTHPGAQGASTPLLRKGKPDLVNLHTTISPIYNMVDDKSYTVTAAPLPTSRENYDATANPINSATLIKKSNRPEIPNGNVGPENTMALRQPLRVPSSASYSVIPPAMANTGAIRKTSLPASKLRQYSSHKELRIPAASNGVEGAGSRAALGRAIARRGVYASNPALCAAPAHVAAPACVAAPARQNSYTIAVNSRQKDDDIFAKPVAPAPRRPALVRQGTETLRRERPLSQLTLPKDLRSATPSCVPVSVRSQFMPPVSRPMSAAASARAPRPASGPAHRHPTAPAAEQRTTSGTEMRNSALPRPSRLPGPRRGLRPPSVYSVAPTTDDRY